MAASKYERMFCGGLLIPERLNKRTLFCASSRFVVPKELYHYGYVTRIENQGSLPWCAAYSATSFAESVLWRKRGYPEEIDPGAVYRYAKSIDGDPSGDGTTLPAAMTALVELGHFDGSVCKVKTFGGRRYGSTTEQALENLKMTLHRHGTCIVGFDIDTSWFEPSGGVVKGGGEGRGGHAVTVVGYDEGGVVIANSWGASWGNGGMAYIPNLVFDREFIYGSTLKNCMAGIE